MDLRYNQEVKKYGKKDAILAICLVLLVTPLLALRPMWMILPINWEALPYYVQFLLRWPSEKIIYTIVPVVIIISIKKQGLASIGIHKENLWPALRLGLIISLAPVFFGILPMVLYGGEFVFVLFVVWLVRTIIFAATEDVLFVGFLQTRLYGVFKSDLAAISVGATLFSFMHVPAWLMTGLLSFDNLPLFVGMVFSWFAAHFMLVAIYRRYNSLVPVTIVHTLWNFFLTPHYFWMFADEYLGYAQSWAQTGILVMFIAVLIWVFVRYRRSKTKQAQQVQ